MGNPASGGGEVKDAAIKILPGTGRGTRPSLVEGGLTRHGTPSTVPRTVPLTVPGRTGGVHV